MTHMISKRFRRTGLAVAATALALLFAPVPALALDFGDIEKPIPKFEQSGDAITAKLTPRAKSNSIVILFKAAGGRLKEVAGVDFESAKRPEVDAKDFRSALFRITVGDMPKGGEAQVSLTSDFFSRSTAFYVFNEKLPAPWADSLAERVALPDRVYELVVTVKDGGPFDSDGAADGVLTLVGGPRDSFWGYALGTLFIRFAGIFIVLCVLMVGMLFSGYCFGLMEKRKYQIPSGMIEAASAGQTVAPGVAQAPAAQPADITDEEVAAIALALHLDLEPDQPAGPQPGLESQRPSTWTQDGLNRMMSDRFIAYNRTTRRKD